MAQQKAHFTDWRRLRDCELGASQIHENEYHHGYLDSGKEVILVGANFSTEKRNIESWKIEPVTVEEIS
jgi:hypothetical protein